MFLIGLFVCFASLDRASQANSIDNLTSFTENNKKIENKENSQAKSIKILVKKSFQALNEENVTAYMSTIDLKSPDYAQTKEAVSKVSEYYDLKYELNSVDILKISTNEAIVRIIQTTKKIRGEDFKNNRIESLNTLKKIKGQWKFYSSQVENIEFLN
ncbi:MAG: hypothetical protein ACRC2R_05080 [Xenococcaceae cyanobacterium]